MDGKNLRWDHMVREEAESLAEESNGGRGSKQEDSPLIGLLLYYPRIPRY